MIALIYYMTKIANILSKSTNIDGFDPLEACLEELRIIGNLVLHETYVAPWAIEIPPEPALRRLLNLDASLRVFPFHLVTNGRFVLTMEGQPPHTIAANEVALCMQGAAHRMGDGQDGAAIPLAEIFTSHGTNLSQPKGRATTIICGAFVMSAYAFNPLLASLPAIMTIPINGADTQSALALATNMLLQTLSTNSSNRHLITSRLLEIFCAELIRHYADNNSTSHPGWFAVLADPKLKIALRHIHHNPGYPWSVSELAHIVALSPSRFAARFREKFGKNIQAYLISQRMAQACKLLQETEQSLTEIAMNCGYASTPTFSRSFTDHFNMPPGKWRHRYQR
ncbi:MAG: cupin domain-containing protein [bacterium]